MLGERFRGAHPALDGLTARARPSHLRPYQKVLGRVVLLALVGWAGESNAQRDLDLTSPDYFRTNIRPLFSQYCLRCHSTEKQKGDLDLEQFATLKEALRQPKVWLKVTEQLANHEMPPKNKPQPEPVERERLAGWVTATLDQIGKARAGDPGPVVLRRLSNVEYTYTIRDLTGLNLDPAREFPVDGAAGEGFMNTGNALVMSPALLTKYFDAGKQVAKHAVLLPDGIRFSPKTTRRDWTDEILAQIRGFYREFTDPRGGEKVNLQGIVFETNEGGRLPLEKYLAATLAERDSLRAGTATFESVARARGLNAKYLGILWNHLTGTEPSLLLDPLRTRWRQAQTSDAAPLTADVARWQKVLWKFGSVGHIGKVGGPKAWMEPVSPLAAKEEVRFKVVAPPGAREVALYLTASDAGDGTRGDVVLWQRPRLVRPGRPDLLLRDVRSLARELAERRDRMFAHATNLLAAAAEAQAGASTENNSTVELARKHGVEAKDLAAWLEYLGITAGGALKIEGYFTNTISNGSGYDFIRGWGSPDTPSLVANSSDQHVRIPGNMKPHGVALHPSPTLNAAVGWRSPVNATMRVEAVVTHAHPECGNGVTWSLELRRGSTRQRLASGLAQGSKEVKVGPFEPLAIHAGDLVSVLIGPRDGNHACDLTAVDLVLTSIGENGNGRVWNLAADVSPDVLAGNPHADRFGNTGVWHFYTEPIVGGGQTSPVIPPGSVLAQWLSASGAGDKQKLARDVQDLLTSGPPSGKDGPDAALYRQLASLGGPLLAGARDEKLGADSRSSQNGLASNAASKMAAGTRENSDWGLDPASFGHDSDGRPIEAASLCVRAPSVVAIRLPADLAAGCEFVTTGRLDPEKGAEGSVQLQVLTAKPEPQPALQPGPSILVGEGGAARKRLESSLDEFRLLFPAALCYSQIVPVDEVITLTLFYREDQHLCRLMLDEAEKAKLDRLWDELHYVSRDALTMVDAFAQLMEYATQDADPKVFEPLRKPINERAAAFKQRLVDTQPCQVEAVLDFAARAYRHTLSEGETREVRELYARLRAEELPHEDAVRLTLARVLVGPSFLYRLEEPGPGTKPAPVSAWELASRLSYFLWSSLPDRELNEVAASGRLTDPDVLSAQARRMLRDPKARRLAIEFGCQWLHVHDFDTLDEKSERHFPTFAALRGDIYEETIRFFTDLFQHDGSVLDILDADYTYLDEALARHYGIPGVTGPEWRRVNGVKAWGRGGILGQASILAKQSGASRTSPILRGNWVAEVLLGDKLPRPPKDVPRLPEDEAATDGLTVRQLVEKHSTDTRCAGCHKRIDPFGFALESYDAIGRKREKDLGDRPIDTRARALDGASFEGLDGLRHYLLTQRREAFVNQFCRKLLGYALGRAVQVSDGPLLTEMRRQLREGAYRVSTAVDLIVRSQQFRDIRGRETPYDD
jgi:Protein of unknown function (DUF1592)/Protein of unknown function (DUF1588)/Protein of unknown function (DUF1587)/Protein of unknown function (DUF1585)/Protein of unknown function (DUF1595)/Planctomycete cytochrome C